MFRKYEKTFRIPTPNTTILTKQCLSKIDVQRLLTGLVTIEEKIDGANVGIIGGKGSKEFRLQKRGSLVDVSEHPQFGRFKAWSIEHYENLMKIKWPTIIFGEFMWATHHIYYDELPDWFICFDIWTGNEFLNRKHKVEVCSELGLQVIPCLFENYVSSTLELEVFLENKSFYSSSELCEGVVVKNYRKQLKGKLVRPSFIKEIDEDGSNWRRHWNSNKVNRLKMV